ncbi:hypothetical protein ACWEVD_09820 [Nocardia thailandica]
MPDTLVWREAEDEEFRQARRLEQVSLFAELNLDYDEIARTRDLLGQVIRDHRRQLGAARLIARFPALTLTTLVGHAGLEYEQGRYWESFWDELGLAREQEFENLLRGRVPALLQRFRMREFPELRSQYVQMLAVHAGVPVYCLGDLVDIIEEHIAHGRDPSGAAVFDWLTQPGMEYRLNRLDMPVRNFLQHGGEVAVDIVDRIIEFADYAREHPDYANDLDLDTSTTGIPSLLLDALIDRWKEKPFGVAAGQAAGRATRSPRPVLAYSRTDDQIVVEVPVPPTGTESPWLVSFDGETTTVHARRGWGIAAGEAQPTTAVQVPRRVREVVLRHEAAGLDHRIPLVDRADPLLVFDEQGRHLSRHVALPRGEVIAVHPARAELCDLHTGAPAVWIVGAIPVGWQDWVARVYDLSETDAVVLRDDNRLGTPRRVRRTGSARLELPEPVEGTFTRSGMPVYAERPGVDLPPHVVEPVEWRIRVRHHATVDWLADDVWVSATEEVSLDPFEGLAPGLFGFFDVVISGPLGQDIRHTLFLAEGLEVEHAAEFRVPVPNGLAATVATVTVPPPLRVDQASLEFGVTDRETQLAVHGPARTERLVVRPPAVELRVDPVGTAARWRTVAPMLTVDDLAEHRIAAARVPGSVEVDIVLTDEAGEIHQFARPEVGRDNVFHAPTREFADTARALRRSRLMVRIDTEDDETTSVVLARIQPRRLIAGVVLDGNQLVFSGAADPDLAAYVWPRTAPWRAPIQVRLAEGRAPLPPEFIGAGSLTVQVFVDDPWTVITAPDEPDDTALTVSQPGWMTDSDPGRADLSRFLAGAGELPSTSSAVPEAWTVFASARSSAVRTALREVLHADPRSSIEALDRSTLARADAVPLLIATGLVERDFSSPIQSAPPTDPWLRCLVGIADLPFFALRQPDSVAAERLRSGLANYGGGPLLDLLAGDPAPSHADIFDAGSVALHYFPAEQFAEMKAACGIIPAALLDPDTRRGAIFEAFEHRLDWQNDPAREEMIRHSAELMPLLRRAARPVYEVVGLRNEALDGADTARFPWLLLSLQSLLFAAVARLRARSQIRDWSMPAPMRDSWRRLAELCPALVRTDILIADALASYALHQDVFDTIGGEQ